MKEIFKRLLCSVLLLVAAYGFSQEGMPTYNMYLLGDEYLLHPSMAGQSVCGNLSFSARQQWFSEQENPASYVLSFNTRLGERRGLGGYLIKDDNGPTQQTGLQLTYNHHLVFNSDEVSHPHRLMMALSGQFYRFNYKFGTDAFQDFTDEVLVNDSYNNFNANVSFTYLNGYLRTSFTANSLFAYKGKDDGNLEPVNLQNYITTVEYKFKPEENISLTPSVSYIMANSQRRDMLDLSLKASLAFDEETRMWLRADYRAYVDESLQSLAITPILGADFSNWKIAYSYDFGIGDYSTYYGGTHQIFLGMKILCKNRCRCSYDEW